MIDITLKQDIAALESQIENISEQLNTLLESTETQYANIVALLQGLEDKIDATASIVESLEDNK